MNLGFTLRCNDRKISSDTLGKISRNIPGHENTPDGQSTLVSRRTRKENRSY